MRSPGELAAAVRVEHLDLIQREAQRGERGRHEIGVVPDADRMAGDLPAGQVAGQAVFCFNVCSTGSAVFFRSVG